MFSRQELTIAVLLLFSTQLYAVNCSAYSCKATIKKLYPHENGNVYIQANADMSHLDCTLNQGRFMVLQPDNKNHAAIYSMLLSAVVAKKVLVMRAATNSKNCRLAYTMWDSD